MKSYNIQHNRITFYPMMALRIAAIALLIFFGITIFGTYAYIYSSTGAISESFSINIILSAIAFAPFVIMYLVSLKKIIFDANEQSVKREMLFTTKTLLPFSEIDSIKHVGGMENSYKIFSKKDKYGKGISLISARGNRMQAFENNVLPVLRKMTDGAVNAAKQPRIAAPITDYMYYSQRGDLFVMKPYGLVPICIMILVCAPMAIYFNFYSHDLNGKSELKWAPLIPLTIGIVMATRKKYFDLSEKTFTSSFLGFINIRKQLKQFERFMIVRKTMNGMYNGTDIRMELKKENGKKEVVTLREIRSTKKIDPFLEETKSIMRQCNINATDNVGRGSMINAG